MRYPAGIMRWLKEEIQTTNVKTRKLLAILGGFNPKSSTLRLYTSGKDETTKLH